METSHKYPASRAAVRRGEFRLNWDEDNPKFKLGELVVVGGYTPSETQRGKILGFLRYPGRCEYLIHLDDGKQIILKDTQFCRVPESLMP
jgi:hypothetical protein